MITEKELDEKYPIPKDVKDLYDEGFAAGEMGDNSAALDIYLKVLKEYPDHPKVLNAVAWMHRREGRFAEAEVYFLRAISVAPNYVFAYNNLGLMYSETGEYEKAADYARRSIGLLKSSAIPWNTLGIYYLDVGEVRRALEHFLAAYGYDPGFNKAAYNIACCYSQLGDKEKALEYLAIGVDTARRLELAENDSDFDNIRELPEFKEILNEARASLADPNNE